MQLPLDTEVADNQWRQLTLQRVGRHVDLRISEPSSATIAENRSADIAGDRVVLNLYDETRHLFVGGVPAELTLPDAIHHRSYVGDVDALRLNGESIGLWNAERAVGVSGTETRSRVDDDTSAEEHGVISLNGRGYTQLGVGAWNARKCDGSLLIAIRCRKDVNDLLTMTID